MDYVYLVAGLALLVAGAEGLVRGGVGIAKRLGVSPLLIGLTVVAWGTSTPELIVSLEAALQGNAEIAVGNVVGSNIFNVLFILGVAASVSAIIVKPKAIARDAAVGFLAAVALLAIMMTSPRIEAWHGMLLLGALVAHTLLVYFQERRRAMPEATSVEKEADVHQPLLASPWVNVVFIAVGLAALIVGAKLLIDAAVAIARSVGVSDAVIGLTLVAAGTSLPELATSAVAAWRKHSEIALGNVLGSNIYNIFAILGIASLVSPVPIPPTIVRFDVWILLAASALVFLPALTGGRIGRVFGLIFFVGYVAYVFALFSQQV